MLVDEQDIMLEARIKMWLQTKLYHDLIVMAINVGINPIQPFVDLSHESGERLRKCNACLLSTPL